MARTKKECLPHNILERYETQEPLRRPFARLRAGDDCARGRGRRISLPVAQRVHTLPERYQWQAVSNYLHESESFVSLARLDETLVEAAFLATGTDGRFVQVPPKTRHTTLFYQNDHLGTPQELLDDSGTGRFISRDSIGLAGGINVYAYAPNPVTWTDPLGLRKRAGCPGKFHSFHDFELPEDKLFASDSVQFRLANKALIQKMNTDSAYRRDMLGRNPALLDWMKDLI